MYRGEQGAATRARVKRGARTLVVMALLAGCSEQIPIHVQPNPLASFADYHTYAWVTAPPTPAPGAPETGREVFGWRVENAVDTALKTRGYLLDERQPDLLVRTLTTIEERYADTIQGYQHYRNAGGEQPLFSAFSLGYEEATVIVELYDAQTHALLWRGSTAIAMDAKRRADRAAAGVAEMFKSFPARQG
ncbi:MAG: DUF4136 domain-containing protein [Candidatus Binatia bacterium]